VLGGDEVHVVAAAPLEPDHQLGDLVGVALASIALLRDVPVLAEHAAQVAEAEEDGSGASPAPQAVFLAEVGERAGDDGVPARVAGARLAGEAVAAAVARAGAAVAQLLESGGDTGAQPRGGEPPVRRLEVVDHERLGVSHRVVSDPAGIHRLTGRRDTRHSDAISTSTSFPWTRTL